MCTSNNVLPPPTSAQEAHLLSKGLRDGEMLWCLDWMGFSDFIRSQEMCYLLTEKHKSISCTARSKRAAAWRSNGKWILLVPYPDPCIRPVDPCPSCCEHCELLRLTASFFYQELLFGQAGAFTWEIML